MSHCCANNDCVIYSPCRCTCEECSNHRYLLEVEALATKYSVLEEAVKKLLEVHPICEECSSPVCAACRVLKVLVEKTT